MKQLIQYSKFLEQQGKLRHIDLQVARQLSGYEIQHAQRSQLAEEEINKLSVIIYWFSVLLGNALAKGQVCLPLTQEVFSSAQEVLKKHSHCEIEGSDFPSIFSQCYCVFNASGKWKNQPLVLDESGSQPRLYLARYYFYEEEVVDQLQQRLQPLTVSEKELQQLSDVIQTLFPPQQTLEPDWQCIAASTACLNRFAVITGGPGTGKTTTVTKLLAALLNTSPGLNIALAAPTGKAAARMTESIRAAKLIAEQNDQSALYQKVPEDSHTLHRLLGFRPQGFAYNKTRHLPYDCVVLDEASMVDLAMMHRLLVALKPEARLILLGDKDQLASVEAGSILADLCHTDELPKLNKHFAERLNLVSHQQLPEDMIRKENDTWLTGIQNAVVNLRVSHRFHQGSGIGHLARAINQGQVQAAFDSFQQYDDVNFLPHQQQAGDLVPWHALCVQGYQSYCHTVREGDIDAIFQSFSDFQILTATRKGWQGSEQVNADMERLLRPALTHGKSYSKDIYPGKAIIITRNDYDLSLFNGDIGIVVETQTGQSESHVTTSKALKVAFMGSDGEIRLLLPSRLPQHEAAFAITVHKSQGSEFQHVALLLPSVWQPVIGRELIYTAVTRARHAFTLYSTQECWQAGINTRTIRASGLHDKLWKTRIKEVARKTS